MLEVRVSAEWSCHIVPAWILTRVLNTQIKFDCKRLWMCARSTPHTVAEPQYFSLWEWSINTDWLHDWIPEAPKLHRSIMASPFMQLQLSSDQLWQPGVKNGERMHLLKGVFYLRRMTLVSRVRNMALFFLNNNTLMKISDTTENHGFYQFVF